MTIKLLGLVLIFFAIPCISSGKDKCTKGSEFIPPLCPLRLEKISTIQIEENGARTNVSLKERIDCSSFKLDAKKVRIFFSRAKVVDELAALHTLDASLCDASGTLKFASGKKAHWTIGHLQEGWLYIEENNSSMTLYCPACKFKPFIY